MTDDPEPNGKRDIGLGGVIAIVMFLACSGSLALYWPRLSGARWAAHVTQSRNNLRYMGLGLYNYHDVYAVFPAGGTTSRDGHPYHSWQTVIMPFIDGAPLYTEIDFDYPWDDPVNRHVFQRTLPVYLNPAISAEGPINGYGISHYAGNSRLLSVNTYLSMRDVTDRTSNTLMAGEVANGFKPWGDPTNLRDPANGIGNHADMFGVGVRPGAQFLMVDGSVRLLSETIDPDALKALATPDGGEVVVDF